MAAGIDRKINVLYVEDDEKDIEVARHELEDRGVNVRACRTATEAVQCLRSASFDAVLLDLNLPDSSGLDSLRRILPFSEAPVIILTASSDPQDRMAVKAIQAGAASWLEKGAFGPEIVRTIRLEIARQSLTRLRKCL